MSTIIIPVFAISRPTAAGSRLGWTNIEVEVPDAAPSEFALAVCSSEQGPLKCVCFNTYAARGDFWEAAGVDKMVGIPAVGQGILVENPYVSNGRPSRIADLQLADRLHGWNLTDKMRRGIEGGKHLAINQKLDLDKARDEDIEYYRDWAERHLLLSEGRLFKKVHVPSFSVADLYGKINGRGMYALDVGTEHAQEFGSGTHRRGLHFEWPSAGVETLVDEAHRQMGVDRFVFRLYGFREFGERIVAFLRENSGLGGAVAFDNVAYFPDVIASVENRQTMEERSVLGTAGSIGRMAQPHNLKPGKKRDIIFALKEHFETRLSDRGADFTEVAADLLADLLAERPFDREPARTWVVKAVLDKWNDRDISLGPAALTSPRGVSPRA